MVVQKFILNGMAREAAKAVIALEEDPVVTVGDYDKALLLCISSTEWDLSRNLYINLSKRSMFRSAFLLQRVAPGGTLTPAPATEWQLPAETYRLLVDGLAWAGKQYMEVAKK